MKLVIHETVPSKKNSRIVNRKTGKSFPSKIFTAWEKKVLPELKKQSQEPVTTYPVGITMIFYNDNNRRHDLDNQASSVLDSLVKAGILEDDNQTKVETLQLQYGGIDKHNPRCEVFIDD